MSVTSRATWWPCIPGWYILTSCAVNGLPLGLAQAEGQKAGKAEKGSPFSVHCWFLPALLSAVVAHLHGEASSEGILSEDPQGSETGLSGPLPHSLSTGFTGWSSSPSHPQGIPRNCWTDFKIYHKIIPEATISPGDMDFSQTVGDKVQFQEVRELGIHVPRALWQEQSPISSLSTGYLSARSYLGSSPKRHSQCIS